jgi:hypothetical protein
MFATTLRLSWADALKRVRPHHIMHIKEKHEKSFFEQCPFSFFIEKGEGIILVKQVLPGFCNVLLQRGGTRFSASGRSSDRKPAPQRPCGPLSRLHWSWCTQRAPPMGARQDHKRLSLLLVATSQIGCQELLCRRIELQAIRRFREAMSLIWEEEILISDPFTLHRLHNLF